MNLFMKKSDERGQGLVEYALILVLVAVVVIGILLILGPTVAQVYCQVSNALQPGSCGVIERVELNPNRGPSSIEVRVYVSEDTTLTITNSHNSSVQSQSCSAPSCAFSVTGLGSGAGAVTIADGEGLTTVVSFPAD